MPKAQQKIIDTLATLETMKIFEMKKAVVAALAGYSPDSGGFNASLAALRADANIEYLDGGRIRLLEKGRNAAVPETGAIYTNADVHELWFRKLKTPSKTSVLKYLLNRYPHTIPKTDIAAACGYSANSGGFNASLAELRAIGLIDYRDVPGQGSGAYATDLLFPFS